MTLDTILSYDKTMNTAFKNKEVIVGCGDVIKLENWATVVDGGNYCKPEEQDLLDIHLKGRQVPKKIHIDGITLKGIGRILFGRITSSISEVIVTLDEHENKHFTFVTASGSHYELVGEPDADFRKICKIDSAEKLAEIINKKRVLF